MSVLVLAEIDGDQIKVSSLQAITAAAAWNLPIDVLVYGNQVDAVSSNVLRINNVARVLVAQATHFSHPLVEDVIELAFSIGRHYTHIITAHTSFGRSVLPAIAARLDVAAITDVIAIEANATYVRPGYAGNIITRIQNHEPIQLVSVRATAFRAAQTQENTVALRIDIQVPAAQHKSYWLSEQITHSDRPELHSARVVIAGGRSLGEKFDELLNPLAEKLDAAIGATRACVDAGFAANDLQVGQTGTIIAPDLYIAVGISGAVQHLAGIKDSKTIVAINHDPDAPIFKYADYGLVADLFTTLPELHEALAQH
ncbi:FAD-binding protein [Cellvibrio sp. pealriver]|uniref:FAD-binding protein n=1 Tax=Cellvibrio sp. pealriver TaxID=1622269 RepID=UPI00066FF0A7|nr:FAD-binding protein [Cellvibrio sp. pealriver]